ncbi:MAG: 8-oxo-dGTP diphosphatase [Lachnospiraceae bacterium]|nr:8-oxo-dGTP diphosphatase [Lachnospiraceae bacterium]
MFINSTLCYLIKGDEYLMLHRTKKEKDLNKDKWIGVGGKLEEKESPEDCVKREVYEETGYALISYSFRGLVTFVYKDITEFMYLYTSDDYSGEQRECSEGELAWVKRGDVYNLPIWEGDKLFFKLLEEAAGFFSLKLVYDDEGGLLYAEKNGEAFEWRDSI